MQDVGRGGGAIQTLGGPFLYVILALQLLLGAILFFQASKYWFGFLRAEWRSRKRSDAIVFALTPLGMVFFAYFLFWR